jgi:hypothetical protein
MYSCTSKSPSSSDAVPGGPAIGTPPAPASHRALSSPMRSET